MKFRHAMTSLAPILIAGATAATFAQPARTERTVVRDTIVVRTVGAPANAGTRQLVPVLSFGSVDGPDAYVFGSITELERAPDGSLWLFDSQARILKRFDSTGKFMRAVGRSGEGPNEYGHLNGLAILRDGTAMLWDGPRWRMLLFSAAGEPVTTWKIPGVGEGMSYSSSGSLYRDSAGFIYASMPMRTNTPSPGAFGVMGAEIVFLKMTRDGRVLDTLRTPTYGVIPSRVERSVPTAGGRSSRASIMVPFPRCRAGRGAHEGTSCRHRVTGTL